jgi:hypothetical protein
MNAWHARPETTWARGELAVAFLALAFGVGGLSWLTRHVSTFGNGVHAASKPARTYLTRTEVRLILVPRSFVELAKTRGLLDSLHTHADLEKCLESRGMERAWYVINSALLQSNGEIREGTRYCCPHDDPSRFQEFRVVIAALQKKPSWVSEVDFSKAEIHIMPELAAREAPGTDVDELIVRCPQIEGSPADE